MLPSWWVAVLFTSPHVKVAQVWSITRGPTASRCRFEQVVGTALGWTMNRKYDFLDNYMMMMWALAFLLGFPMLKTGWVLYWIEAKRVAASQVWMHLKAAWWSVDDQNQPINCISDTTIGQHNNGQGIIFSRNLKSMYLQARNYEPRYVPYKQLYIYAATSNFFWALNVHQTFPRRWCRGDERRGL